MSEIVIKIGGGAGYENGDILAAFSRRRIDQVHIDHLTHVKDAGITSEGLRPAGSLARKTQEIIYQYKFERVSRTAIERTDLATSVVEVIDDVPRMIEGKMQHMDVPEFVLRRVKHARHRIFGTIGREFWFGGKSDTSPVKLAAVWTVIEASTAHNRNDPAFHWFPLGRQDLKSHLAIPIPDIDDDIANRLTEPIMRRPDPDPDPEEPDVVARKRKWVVDWTTALNLPAAVVERIEDRRVVVDLRQDFTAFVLDRISREN